MEMGASLMGQCNAHRKATVEDLSIRMTLKAIANELTHCHVKAPLGSDS